MSHRGQILQNPAPAHGDQDLRERAAALALLPIAEPPFVLGSRSVISVWRAAFALSRSLYS